MVNGILAVGFDVDGTLYKANALIQDRIQEYACRIASERLAESYETFRPKFDKKYAELDSANGTLKALGIENGIDIVQEALEKTDIASLLSKDSELSRMMDKLFFNHKLFIITGGNDKETSKKLQALGIEPGIFEKIITTDQRNYRREDGTAFPYISKTLGVNYQNMLFVGDREKVDIAPAAKFGLKTAIVNAKSSLATYQLEKIYDLEKILE